MAITVTAEQRDALCDLLLDRLNGVEDIRIALQKEDIVATQRLGREYSDDLRLLEGLGWGEGKGQGVTLKTPPEVLRRALPRLSEVARRHSAGHEPAWTELSELRERNQLVEEACRHVLAELGGG